MIAVYVNPDHDDDERRRRLYDGHLYAYSATDATRELVQVARDLCEEAFDPHDPVEAQHHMDVETYVEILKDLKPTFIHHPRCKAAIQRILTGLGCDADRTFFDVPRLRTATSDGYLTSGLGYAFKPHRDTWYSPPMCQLNWWLPVYPIHAENAMAFHTRYWDEPIENSSAEFNYQEWNRLGREQAKKQKADGKDTRKQSEALEPVEPEPDLRIVPEPSGLLVFSGAHLHSTVDNTTGETRISIDFRTVHLDELETESGAPNLDSESTGTTIHDYLRLSDLSHVPEEILAMHVDEPIDESGLSPQFRGEGANAG